MSPIDLNSLPLEAAEEVTPNWDNYQEPTEFPPPPPEGDYNMKQLRLESPSGGYNEKTGVLSFEADWQLYDLATGNEAGKFMFDRFSNLWYGKEKNRNNAVDFLRSYGITDRPRGPRGWYEAVMATKQLSDQGQVCSANLRWEGYCSHEGTPFETLFDHPKGADGRRPSGSKPLPVQPEGHKAAFEPKGMKKWPQEASVNGAAPVHDSVMPCPTCGQEVRARLKANRRIPK